MKGAEIDTLTNVSSQRLAKSSTWAPWINDIAPGSASTAMHLVGVVEIIAGSS